MASPKTSRSIDALVLDVSASLTLVKANAQHLIRKLDRGETIEPAALIEGLRAIDAAADRATASLDELTDACRDDPVTEHRS